ncbi:MAG: hypothetical protein ACKOYM_04650, partial [Actinomycetes bacterium]
VVLCGSVYLILATNTGVRTGFLIAITCLTGWMFTMGAIWWTYGIGLKGKDPSWIEREVNFTRDDAVSVEQVNGLPRTEDLPNPVELLGEFTAANPDVAKRIEATEGADFEPASLTKAVTVVPELKTQLDDQLNGWRILPESDARRGDAVAASDATLIATKAFGEATSSADYTTKDVFFYGGKPAAEPETIKGERGILQKAWNRIETTLEVKNPPLFAAVTLRKNIPVVAAPGEAPPPPQMDPKAEIVTVVLERNLGNKRLIPALFCLFNGILFAVFAWMLHTRDKRAMAARAEWTPAKAS